MIVGRAVPSVCYDFFGRKSFFVCAAFILHIGGQFRNLQARQGLKPGLLSPKRRG